MGRCRRRYTGCHRDSSKRQYQPTRELNTTSHCRSDRTRDDDICSVVRADFGSNDNCHRDCRNDADCIRRRNAGRHRDSRSGVDYARRRNADRRRDSVRDLFGAALGGSRDSDWPGLLGPEFPDP